MDLKKIPRLFLTGLGWVWPILFAVIVGIFCGLIGMTPVAMAPFYVLALLCLLSGRRILRKQRGLKVLGYIQETIALSLPLSSMMAAAAESEHGTTRRRLKALSLRLRAGAPLAVEPESNKVLSYWRGQSSGAGQPLGSALAAVPEIPLPVRQHIATLERAGLLHQCIQNVGRNQFPSQQSQGESFYRNYAAIFGITFLALAGGLSSGFLYTKLAFISHQSHVALPWALRTMRNLAYFESDECGIFLLMIAILLAFGVPGSGPRQMLLRRLPVLGERSRSLALATVFRHIAASVHAGRPLDLALADAVDIHGHWLLRRQIKKWSTHIESGQSLSESAASAGMPGLVTGMLAAARTSDDLATTAEFLADYYESRFVRLDEILRAVYIPGLVLLMGLATLLVALSIFQTMIRLVEVNSRWGGF